MNRKLILGVIFALALTDCSTLHASSIKQKRGMNLIPTLTVDVGPLLSQLPVPFNMGNVMEYHFPVGEKFNLTCVIKHPSFQYHMQVSRQVQFNNGTKGDQFSLIAGSSYNPNPEFPDQENRLLTEFKSYFGSYDPTAQHFKVSVIMNNLQIVDSGFYTCRYQNITKEVKVIVFKQAHSKSIDFPDISGNFIKKMNLSEPSKVSCRVNEVYPKPVISFVLPNGEQVRNSKINTTDLSPSDQPIFAYSQKSEVNFTPKYSDHQQNLTCSVFTIGSTNLTVQKTLLLNVEGFQLIKEKCLTYFTGSLGDYDIEYHCTYFANPKISPTFSTKKTPEPVKKIANELANKLDNIQLTTPIATPLNKVVKSAKNKVNQVVESVLKISEYESADSNYVSSVEELNSGLYKAVLKLKQVALNDYKDFTMEFKHNGKVTKKNFSLKKIGYDKRIKGVLGGSASFLSNNIIHSTIVIALTSLFIKINR